MQFVPGGPEVPELLLQRHREGRVVFFCGAGISLAARLPDFKSLVEKVFTNLGGHYEDAEKAAMAANQFDTAIGLLEKRRRPNGRQQVRREIVNELTPNLSAPGATDTHDALLTLAGIHAGPTRLVTTNFDRLFRITLRNLKLSTSIYRAPLLPVTKKTRWDGIVYLHGYLPERPTSKDLENIVISSGDFGLAYLIEGWAARFVSELFQNYTVCFIGYSITDPILKYMMDALAADRLLGESPPEAYAFASFSMGGHDAEHAKWSAKHVIPIMYNDQAYHSLLHNTLKAWAQTHRDGTMARERIVSDFAHSHPIMSTAQDNYIGRVLWALCEDTGLPAKRFATLDPIPPFEWLEQLATDNFCLEELRKLHPEPRGADPKFSFLSRPTPLYDRSAWIGLVYDVRPGWDRRDKIMTHLGHWLARHINDPRLLIWIARKGGILSGNFRDAIAAQMENVRPELAHLWNLVLNERLARNVHSDSLYEWLREVRVRGLTSSARLRFREILSPRVQMTPASLGEPDALPSCEVVLGSRSIRASLQELRRNPALRPTLPALLQDLTTVLSDTFDLMEEIHEASESYDPSYYLHPSISEHPQNMPREGWTVLVGLLRDAWLDTAASRPDVAKAEVYRWSVLRYPFFRRLVLFACANSTIFSLEQSVSWLISGQPSWLWALATRRECLRLLNGISALNPGAGSEALEAAILSGPENSIFSANASKDEIEQRMAFSKLLRLATLEAGGWALGTTARIELERLRARFPHWVLSPDQSHEFPYWIGPTSDISAEQYVASPKSVRELVAWLEASTNGDRDDWRERCKDDVRRAASALLHLAKKGVWNSDRWSRAFNAWMSDQTPGRSWRLVVEQLIGAPVEFLKKVSVNLSWWLQSISKTSPTICTSLFALAARVLRVAEAEENDRGDAVLDALNTTIGRLTDSIVKCWLSLDLKDGQKIRDDVKDIFNIFYEDPSPRYFHSRTILAWHVIVLHRVDDEWSVQHVFPQSVWGRSTETAAAAWQAFLWSPRPYPPLLDALRSELLRTVDFLARLGKFREQYVTLFTMLALERRDLFDGAGWQRVFRTLETPDLVFSLRAIATAAEGQVDADASADYWSRRISPFFREVWPAFDGAYSDQFCEESAKLCLTARSYFPSALELFEGWDLGIAYPSHIVERLFESGYCAACPGASLLFLGRIVAADSDCASEALARCLDSIVACAPALAQDSAMMRLRDFVRVRQA